MEPRARRVRIDQLLVSRGLAETRARAQALILAGRVSCDGHPAAKAGALVGEDASLEIADAPSYVSRAGPKLAGALRSFGLDAAGRLALDVGASTGGFTDVLLEAGAAKVCALDVGRGQLDWTLRNDPRVVPLEGVNARYLTPEALPFRPSLAVVDVSFISLERVLPAIRSCLTDGGEIVALVKPQFEVGRARVGKGGIVRDPALHREVLERLAEFSSAQGIGIAGIARSPIKGATGNVEFFLHLTPGRPGLSPGEVRESAARVSAAPEPSA
jgi:23S rRNA (cytidine1920-2'-O)/16S rRNA (cytidine1409-2'-O)-methyltransferase